MRPVWVCVCVLLRQGGLIWCYLHASGLITTQADNRRHMRAEQLRRGGGRAGLSAPLPVLLPPTPPACPSG